MRSAFFWDIKQRWVVVLYRRFGTTYWSHLQGFRLLDLLKTGPIGWPETSVQKVFTLEDGTDRVSRNVGTELLLNAV
jgi:hypothetical protein